MSSLLGTILRSATRKEGEPLNILTFPTHERYETSLCKTDHNFYAFRGNNIKDWNTTYAPLPANYTLLEREKEPPIDIDFDLILSQNKFGQYPVAQYLSKKYHCPLISLEHTLPFSSWNKEKINALQAMRGNIDVFISEYSIDAWGYLPEDTVKVIRHGVDEKLFAYGVEPRREHLLSVVNDWPNRDWCCGFRLWQEITQGLPVYVVGKSPGFSEPASSVEELVDFYQQSQVFLNTSLISPVPMALLEAMSCGCAVVSTATCMIPEFIQHGVNGLISNDAGQLREYCKALLDDPEYALELGKAARKTIEEEFCLQNFVDIWNKLFIDVSDNLFVKG